ncbi:MAG TPA: DNA methyltransferase [Herpetosiphonaceae bacterium]
MATQNTITRHDHLTFKGNLKQTRYGWLRLTPAYSVHLVAELLDKYASTNAVVLDPFCGTGTTALVCAERGVECETGDINPFLVWLSETKTHAYDTADLDAFGVAAAAIAKVIQHPPAEPLWIPPLHQIEKWWSHQTLQTLAHMLYRINSQAESLPGASVNLLKVAFCRTMIDQSNASFAHQSMSFKKSAQMSLLFEDDSDLVLASWEKSVAAIAASAHSPIVRQPRVLLCDARSLTTALPTNSYSCVITSPPYPNRMSYIRELRPYMYWLGYLRDGRAAGELDWQAIGGTWGIATSKVAKWTPEADVAIPFDEFYTLLMDINRHSPVLSRYVHKYFYDMMRHCNQLFQVVKSGGTIHYIVGNSKFFDVLLPVERIFAALFELAGFEDVRIRTLRKRTSKRELFEYVVSAQKP